MKAIELFAGAGGLGLGISKAGFKPIKVIEWDKWCCDTIRENQRNKKSCLSEWPKPIEDDIRNIDFSAFEGKIDLVSGGPPCQPFSLGGKHLGHSDERDMWPQAVRVVRETRPKAFVFENVKGLTRSTFATYLSYISLQLSHPEILRKFDERWIDHLARLESHHTSGTRGSIKYNVVHRVLNSADYGIPQRRERIVFVGFREDLGIEWHFPNATHSLEAMLWSQCKTDEYWDRHRVPTLDRTLDCRVYNRGMRLEFKPNTKPWVTVRDSISDLPDPETELKASQQILSHRFQPGAKSYYGHTGSPLDEPAKTLKAGVHGVPGGENMLLRPDGSVRYFTVRESARLQTFPDSFRFNGSWSETMRQLGNAVPVKLAQKIGSDIAKQLRAAA